MQEFECRGAPRDLGLDQGRALRNEIRASLEADSMAGRLAGWRPDPATKLMQRDLRRYFPHQAEWLEGMATGAGVSERALVRELARRTGIAALPCPVLGVQTGGALRLSRPLPPGAILRRAAPEGRFASLEVGWPEGSAPLLGVNEAGFAVAVAGAVSRPEAGAVAPPVALFARDCLERFDCVDAALEWCVSRPAAPGGALLFADAEGGLCGVDAETDERGVLQPVDGRLLWGAPESALTSKPVAHVDPVARRLSVEDDSWALS